MISDRRHEHGFSLLEVLIAFALTALFFSAILPSAVSSLDRLVDTHLHSSALAIARSTLERHVVIARFEEGVFDGHQGGFSWRAFISQLQSTVEEPSTLLTLRQIRVEVSTGDAPPIITLSTYQLGEIR